MDKPQIKRVIKRPLKDRPHAISFGTESRTKQQFKDEADINKRIARYRKTGYLTDPLKVKARQAFFGDVTTAEDFQTMQNKVIEVSREFSKLPSGVRKEFDNDPRKLLQFLEDPRNHARAIEMGILEGVSHQQQRDARSDETKPPADALKKQEPTPSNAPNPSPSGLVERKVSPSHSGDAS